MVKKHDDTMPGYNLGFPMYHALTGNLPVISKELHPTSKPDEEVTVTNPGVMPGWVELVDPITDVKFWWNTYYRSKRESRPGPMDDGRRGAGKGDSDVAAKAAARRSRMELKLAGKTWEEKYDMANSRVYYLNKKLNYTQWARPAGFYEDGISYRSKWQQAEGPNGEIMYKNMRTDEVESTIPEDFDGMPITLTEELVWHNYVTGENTKLRPTAIDMPSAKEPAEAAPAPPVEDEDDDMYVDEEEVLGVDLVEEYRVFPPYTGWLKKRGGAYSGMFGSIAWKPRYFVSIGGFLSYYEKEVEPGAKGGEKKAWKINLRYYGVNSLPGEPTQFNLVPLPDAFSAYTHGGGEGMPPPDRIFELDCADEATKIKWIEMLRGKLVDKDGNIIAEVGKDTTEEAEANKAAAKSAAYRAAGKGVVRHASAAVMKDFKESEQTQIAMASGAAGGGLGGPAPGVGMTMRGNKKRVA